MMKITPWKEFTERGQKYRIQATYGLDYDFGRRKNQSPYFSATARIDLLNRRGSWEDDSGGMQHDEIARRFPQLAPYLQWHLVSLGEPLHYLANAKYWWEKAMGIVTPGTRPASPGEPEPSGAFQRTIIFGGIPGETMPSANHWPEVERWLRDRLPKLMGRFAADMQALGVLE